MSIQTMVPPKAGGRPLNGVPSEGPGLGKVRAAGFLLPGFIFRGWMIFIGDRSRGFCGGQAVDNFVGHSGTSSLAGQDVIQAANLSGKLGLLDESGADEVVDDF